MGAGELSALSCEWVPQGNDAPHQGDSFVVFFAFINKNLGIF
jgi:hypothetical protein